MPLVLDPAALPEPTLAELRRSLIADLAETAEWVDSPQARVLDPASLETARELLRSARALLGREGPRSPATLADEANLAYAVMLAAIDLVKSHTEMPRVPRGKGKASG
ncbi:MAG TPA: hypothetical protein VML53_04665 [Thermoplasmata archaeon]|nr:hypothetical protein [Thermoplasmata archaeon]